MTRTIPAERRTLPRAVRVWWVLVRTLLTTPRLVGLGALDLVACLLGAAVHTVTDDRLRAAYRLVDGFGLSLLVPIVALVFASAVLGDPSEDGTLVYLWLRPLPRWQLALAAFFAAAAVSVPVAVVPLAIGAALAGVGTNLVLAALAGGTLATVTYSAIFCGLGLRVRRALAWGMAYLLIWEQAVARVSHGAARISVFINARSVAAHIAGQPPPRNAVAPVTGLVVLLVAIVLAVAFTARSLDQGEIA